jgi:putative transcriptional regulator
MNGVAGRLLVATPDLIDPNFYRTVVLVCAHDDEGAFGLILNRPLDASVAAHLEEWAEHVGEPPLIFEGGPVQRSTAIGLARGPLNREWTIEVAAGFGLINLDEDPSAGDLRDLRVFSGYTGWGAGQLEGEIATDGWFVVDRWPGDAFSTDPDELWRAVLGRQGRDLAIYANFPDDPAAN